MIILFHQLQWLNTMTTKQRMLLTNPTLANTSYINLTKLQTMQKSKYDGFLR